MLFNKQVFLKPSFSRKLFIIPNGGLILVNYPKNVPFIISYIIFQTFLMVLNHYKFNML